MLVKKLVEELLKLDQNKRIGIYDEDYGWDFKIKNIEDQPEWYAINRSNKDMGDKNV